MKTVLFFLLLLSINGICDPVVFLIDTGTDISHAQISNHVDLKELKFHPKDYRDSHGHSTHLAGLILKDVCPEVKLISCKAFGELDGSDTGTKTNDCLLRALNEKPDIINYSGGGDIENPRELEILKKLEAAKIPLVVAVGNAHKDITLPGNEYYPASYGLKNIIVVGSSNKKVISEFSNFGVYGMVWEDGDRVFSTMPNGNFGILTGTSMSAAIYTNKFLKKRCSNVPR